MDFNFTPEQRELRETAIKFARENSRADIVDLDRNSHFPMDQWRVYASFGIQGLIAPKKYDGQEQDLLSCVSVMEGLGYGSNDSGILLSVIAHIFSCIEPILMFGSEDQKDKYLPGLCSGDLIGLHAITEPDAGSDSLKNMKTVAVDKGDHYLLNGTKIFISNGDIADVILVLTKIRNKTGDEKLGCLIVEKNTAGFSTKKIEKMGLKTCPFNELEFKDCFVPKENLLGHEGSGEIIFYHMIFKERAVVMATQLGVMEKQLDTCVKYAKERKQFGKPIIEFESVANMLADMKVRLETSRMLLYKAAWLKDNNSNDSQFYSIAKLYISESAVENSLSAMKIHGGSGYTTEAGLERQMRDSIGGLFMSGTSEIMRKIIAGLL